DTWIEEFDNLPAKAVRNAHRRQGLVYVQSDLPECWVTVNGNSMKCLIDTGAQMNILRLSAARAMKILYEVMQHKPGEPPQGVTSANGTHDPFVGTAFNVPIRIGSVTTLTTFRLVANVTRSAILGGPWCACAKITIQYNAIGRVTCKIVSEDGFRNTVFIASNPAPHHPSQTTTDEDEEADSGNE
ncbi:hypothetical protein B0T12DRAFT_354590, partial [Alternaria alternata]